MSNAKSLRFVVVLMLFTVFSAILATAQQYGIQRAEYGTERKRVDVTDRVRELARMDRPFRMGNSTFGVDPDPGHVKTLRIYASGPNGRQVFEYREGSTVDPTQFNSWGGGNWNQQQADSNDSGQYVILRAEYGTERNHVDVTDRLRELARTDRTFRMGNSTFGVDPDPGHVKTLRIFARGPNGRQVFEYREGSTVDGSQFRGWSGGGWGRNPGQAGNDSGQYVIVRASYGTERKQIDVTDRLRELARTDQTFRMGNSTFGVDPDPGHVKTLRIFARGPNGRERVFEYREGSTVDGSQFRGWGGGNWGFERRR